MLRELDLNADAPPPGAEGYAEFELDLEQALQRQLGPFFDKLPALELTPENINKVVATGARGAYYLLHSNEIVYIGKSDAKRGLKVRLLRHYKTLKRRKSIDWQQMKFKAVKVSSLAALDTESLLLELYKRKAKALGGAQRPEWNFSGFGSNDPGTERDTQRVSVFDQRYPLDLDATLELDNEAKGQEANNLAEYLKWLTPQLLFTFRRDKTVEPATSLERVPADFNEMTKDRSLRGLFLAIHAQLPARWVLTILRGKALLYLDDNKPYKAPLWRLAAQETPTEPDYASTDFGEAGDDEGTEEPA